MVLFILLSFVTNLYVILMFHRITGQGMDFSSGIDSFGIAPPSSSRKRHRMEEKSDDNDDVGAGSDDDDAAADGETEELQLQIKIQSLQDQIAQEEKGHHAEIQALKAKLKRQEEEVRRANARFGREVKSVRGDLQKQQQKTNAQIMQQDSLKSDSMESQHGNGSEGDAPMDVIETQNTREDKQKEDDQEQQEKISLRGNKHRRRQQREQQRKQRQTIQNHKESSSTDVWSKPNYWKQMGFYDIRHHFHCKEYAHDQTKPLPSLEDWQFLRRQYKQIVDPTNANIDKDPIPPTDGYTLLKDKKGPPPFYAELSKDGRGRGLFASRDIQKGELVHNGNQSDFIFPDAQAWRTFIFSLPRKKACDMIDWTWTQKTELNGPFHIFSAMNISILLNDGDEDEQNVMPKSDASSFMYATKDIKKGEELLTDYYIYDTVWDKVGL